MGEMADYEETQREIDSLHHKLKAEEKERRELSEKRRKTILEEAKRSACLPNVWVKKDASLILISEMGDKHVLNALKLLVRAASIRRMSEAVKLVSLPEPNGDAAEDAFMLELDQALERTWKDHIDGFFLAMKAEAQRRGVKGSSDAEIDDYGDDIDRRTNAVEISLLLKGRDHGVDLD